MLDTYPRFEFAKVPNKSFRLSLKDLTRYRRIFLMENASTRADEANAIMLTKAEPLTIDLVVESIERLASWGGKSGKRLFPRMFWENRGRDLVKHLSCAITRGKEGNFTEALLSVKNLRYFGWTYSSKMIRFLFPDTCVALDRIISERLDWQQNEEDYEAWRLLCVSVGKSINWPAADVEASVYQAIREESQDL